LNRRLAPHIYLGVVPVARTSAGLRFEGEGPVIDWAVKMARLPDDATLESQLRRNGIDGEALGRLAVRLAQFHAAAAAGPEIARSAQFERVATLALDNFAPTRSHVGKALSAAVFERLQKA